MTVALLAQRRQVRENAWNAQTRSAWRASTQRVDGPLGLAGTNPDLTPSIRVNDYEVEAVIH